MSENADNPLLVSWELVVNFHQRGQAIRYGVKLDCGSEDNLFNEINHILIRDVNFRDSWEEMSQFSQKVQGYSGQGIVLGVLTGCEE